MTAYSSQQGMKTKAPSGYKSGQLPNFTPEMMELFKSLFSNVGEGSYLSRLAQGDESLFQDMEGQAMKQFGELQGQNASRFSGMGMGARKGSGFQNVQNQASQDFAQNLYSQRNQMRQQAIQDLMGMSGNLLQQKPFENYLVKKDQKPSGWGGIFGGAAGGLIGGIPGAKAGYDFGSQF